MRASFILELEKEKKRNQSKPLTFEAEGNLRGKNEKKSTYTTHLLS